MPTGKHEPPRGRLGVTVLPVMNVDLDGLRAPASLPRITRLASSGLTAKVELSLCEHRAECGSLARLCHPSEASPEADCLDSV
jgi:hypothetical protein